MTLSVRFTIYARHSTDRQNPRSAQDQIDAILHEVSLRHPDWIPVEPFYRDEAVSGTSTTGRDSFLTMIEDAKEGRFDVVLVEDVSRFSRNRMDAVRFRELLADHDVKVLAQSDGYMDPDTETGVFMTALKEAKAHVDVLETGRRVKRGLAAQARKGFITGPPPFGYGRQPVFDESRVDADGRPTRVGVRLEVDPATAPVVHQIFELYASGLGFGRVAARLNEEGVRSARGGTWDQAAIRAIILNEAYIGHIVAHKVEKKRKANGRKRVRRVPASEQVRCDGAHEPIISKELWDECHAILGRRSRAVRENSAPVHGRPRKYLLSGLVGCGTCDGSMIVETSGQRDGKKKYYRCGIRRRRGNTVCDNGIGIPIEKMDTVVSGLVVEEVLEGSRILRIASRALEIVRGSSQPDRAATLERDRTAVEREIENLVAAIASGSVAPRSLVTRLQDAEARKSAIDQEIVRRTRLVTPQRVTKTRIRGAIEKTLEEFRLGAAVQRKREILRHCFESLRLRADGMLEAITNPAGTLELVGVDVCISGAGSGT